MPSYPSQKVSSTVKQSFEWKKANADYFIAECNFTSQDREEMLRLYAAAESRLDPVEYKYVLNPFNTDNPQLINYPAKLRNYDIIKPIVKLFLGEKYDKPDDSAQVIVVNDDVENNYLESLNERMTELALKDVVSRLQKSGILNNGQPIEEIPEYQEAVNAHKSSWKDDRAIAGQEYLESLLYGKRIKDRNQENMYNYLVTGRCFSFKDVLRDDVIYETVHPLEMFVQLNGNSPLVEDGDWAVRYRRLSPNKILDLYREHLTDADVEWLDTMNKNTVNLPDINNVPVTTGSSIDSKTNTFSYPAYYYNARLIDVYHVTWKTFTKVGILTFTNDLGIEEELEVDEDYVLDTTKGDISIRFEWNCEAWEVYRMDKNRYIKGNRLSIQRHDLNNSSLVKLPYHGRIDKALDGTITSMVKDGLPYQALYNIYSYRQEMSIARNKDKMMLMPIGMKPKGWSEDKWLYYGLSTGMLWFDETKPNAAQVISYLKSIDMGLGQYVEQMQKLKEQVKYEWWETIGMNRQRYGDVAASDGKGVNEQAISRSAIISNELFRKFEEFEETDYEGLLDYSKVAWINGKKGTYIRSDRSIKFFTVNPERHLGTSYGVFVKNGTKERNKLNQVKGLVPMFAQAGNVKASSIMEMVDSDNLAKLKDLVKEGEHIQEIEAAREAEANRMSQEKMVEMQNQNAQAERDFKTVSEDKKLQNNIDVALIQADITVMGMNLNQGEGVEVDDTLKREQQDAINRLKEKQETNKSVKSMKDDFNKKKDLELKDKKIENDLKIAKQNKNKYDK